MERATAITKTGYREGLREDDNCFFDRVREMIDTVQLDQDSRDHLDSVVGLQGACRPEPANHFEMTVDERNAVIPNAPAPTEPEPEITVTIRADLVVVAKGNGWSLSVHKDSPRGKRVLTKRQMHQRLSKEQRQIFKFAKLVHPLLGNTPVDAAAIQLGVDRETARAWHLVLRNLMGEAEWMKASIELPRSIKAAYEREMWGKVKARWANNPTWPTKSLERPAPPAKPRIVDQRAETRADWNTGKPTTYPASGMENF